MKLTAKTNELILELTLIESQSRLQFLIGEGSALRKEMMELYRLTDNPRSQELIIEIMSEGGYPWFERLARGQSSSHVRVPSRQVQAAEQPNELSTNSRNIASPNIANAHHQVSVESYPLSENDFMDLLPANGHFH